MGGFHTVDAGTGADGAFRVLVDFNLYRGTEWLRSGEDEILDAGAFSFSWTPKESPFEFYSVVRRWNVNGLSLPSDYQLMGDISLGVKWYRPILPWLLVGGDASVSVPLNTLTKTRRTIEAAGLALRANISADLRDLEPADALPLVFRLNVGYYFDNSWALIRDLERDRYDALPAEGAGSQVPMSDEWRHRLSRTERFGLQLDRMDRLTIAVGVEAPFEFEALSLVVSPIAEWLIDIPIDRQGMSCPRGGPPHGVDPCLTERGASAYRQRALVGVRVVPGLADVSLYTAVEVGLSGVREPVQELFPQVPYRVHFGIAYAYDYARTR